MRPGYVCIIARIDRKQALSSTTAPQQKAQSVSIIGQC
jgi:hypothetical protein